MIWANVTGSRTKKQRSGRALALKLYSRNLNSLVKVRNQEE